MYGTNEQDLQSESPEPQKVNQQGGQSLRQRWLTAAIAMPIVLTFVWFGGWFAFAATVLVVVLGTLELHRMLLHAGYRPLILISLGLSILFLIAAMLPQQSLWLLNTGLGGALLISFPWLFFRKRLEGAMVDWALTLAISLYLGWPMSFFLMLRGYDPGTLHLNAAWDMWVVLPRGAWWLLLGASRGLGL